MEEKAKYLNVHLNDFERHIRTSWNELQHEISFCDATLACEDKQIKVNKSVLSSCSPVLKNIFTNSTQNMFIYLRGVAFEDLQNLINFIHQGEINIAENNLGTFLSLADDLQVVGLSEMMENLLKSAKIPSKTNAESNPSKSPSELQSTKDEIESLEMEQQYSKILAQIGFENSLEEENETSLVLIAKESQSNNTLNVKFKEDNNEAKFSCKDCDKHFKKKTHLKRHIQSFHLEIGFPCDQCDYKAKEPYVLKQHVSSVHNGFRYACSQCEYKGTTQGNLNRHKKSIHDGVNYPCSECEYKATIKDHLKRHMKRHQKHTFL